MLYKKAQSGPVALILLIIIFMINWFIWLGDWVSTAGQTAVIQGGLTGIEAFMYNNLNVFVFLSVVLAIMAWGYFSAE